MVEKHWGQMLEACVCTHKQKSKRLRIQLAPFSDLQTSVLRVAKNNGLVVQCEWSLKPTFASK